MVQMEKAKASGASKERLNSDYYQEHWENAGFYLNKSASARWYNHLVDESIVHVDGKTIKKLFDVGCEVNDKTYLLFQKLPHAKFVDSEFSETSIKEARGYFKNLKHEVGDGTVIICIK